MPQPPVPRLSSGAVKQAPVMAHQSLSPATTSLVCVQPSAKTQRTWLGCTVGALLGHASVAVAAPCALTRIEALHGRQHEQVVLATSCLPEYEQERTNDEKLVLRLLGTACNFRASAMPLSLSAASGLTLGQQASSDGPGCEVTLALQPDHAARVVREGQDIVVTFAPSRGEAPGSLADAHLLSDPTAYRSDAPVSEPVGALAGAGDATADENDHAGVAQGPTEPRNTLLHIDGRADGLWLSLDHPTEATSLVLADPPRFVVDLARTDRALAAAINARDIERAPAWLRGVRAADWAGGTRVVFDLAAPAELTLTAGEHGFVVARTDGPSALGLATAARAVQTPAAQTSPAVAPSAVTASVVAVRYRNEPAHGEARGTIDVVLAGTKYAEAKLEATVAGEVLLVLGHTDLPASLAKRLDTRAALGPVSSVSTFAVHEGETRIVATKVPGAAASLEQTPTGYAVHFAAPTAPVAHAVASERPGEPRARGLSSSLSSLASSLPFAGLQAPQLAPSPGERLRQKRISLDVKDADIINVLRLISEETGENIIASDEVRGRVTMKLRHVSAEQALDTLLRVKGFDRVRTGDILRIASADTIQKERDQEVARKRANIEVEEVVIKMVTVNYATASEVVDQLKPMLSGRGSVQVDARTNTLIMQDIGSNIDSLVELARRLDKQTPLVNIQARIVEADSTFVRDLGVQWGGAVKHTAVTGNPTGLYFPADITAQGTAELTASAAGGAAGAAAAAAPSRYAVNLPASLTGSGAALGFILGSAGGSQLLDLRLSAMETNGNGKVISSPEVSTLDNRTARVSQGVSFAVSTVSAAGTNVKFVPAVLQLEVTPHVTNDGTVLMKLHVQKSAPDFANRSGSGDPSIQTKEAETEVLVKDGDTSVIGGILTRTTTETRNEVPFFSKIPILGLLFREHAQRDVRSELLVFITPRIINRDESKLGAESR